MKYLYYYLCEQFKIKKGFLWEKILKICMIIVWNPNKPFTSNIGVALYIIYIK